MKAITKVDYSGVKKGTEFQIVEIVGTRCTLLIEGRNVDFGISEVEITTNTQAEMFEVGRFLNSMLNNFSMRNSEIDMQIKNIKFPLSKKLISKCIYAYLY